MSPRVLRAAAGVALLGAGIGAPADDWRQAAEFRQAEAAFASWLSTSDSDSEGRLIAWRQSVAESPRPDTLGEPIRRLALEGDGRLASVLAEPAETPPDWIADYGEATPSVCLAVAEHLASLRRYDACLAWTDKLEEEAVYSPRLLRYLRAVAAWALVENEAAAEELDRLNALLETDGKSRLGVARTWIARRLIDAAADADESGDPLATVARRMEDAQRRLAQSEPAKPTQTQQRKAIEALDELIDKLEEQRKQQMMRQQAAGGAGGGAEPGSPAEESRPGELKGPGEVDRKRLVAGDDWGSLPPAERERLTQAITRDFPPHYRALVEDYFRTLAAEADTAEQADKR